MKFGSGLFEVQGITRVVENNVRRVNGKTGKVGKTYVWGLAKTKGGTRWLKYEWGTLKDVHSHAELDQTILTGKSPEDMHDYIEMAMITAWQRVWFSGATCNIETNLTLRDIYEKKAHMFGFTSRALIKVCMNVVDRLLK